MGESLLFVQSSSVCVGIIEAGTLRSKVTRAQVSIPPAPIRAIFKAVNVCAQLVCGVSAEEDPCAETICAS